MNVLFLALLATILLALYLTPTQLVEESDPFQSVQAQMTDAEVEVS